MRTGLDDGPLLPQPKRPPKWDAALEPILEHLAKAEYLILERLQTMPNSGARVDLLEEAKRAIWKAQESVESGLTLANYQCDNCGFLYAIHNPQVIIPLCGRKNCFGHLKTIPGIVQEPMPGAANETAGSPKLPPDGQ